jgi:hypothetical protein
MLSTETVSMGCVVAATSDQASCEVADEVMRETRLIDVVDVVS